ncbi:hypothetical protein EGQ24_00520 [bacterium]|nr:hypothetical protein [bacterium]
MCERCHTRFAQFRMGHLKNIVLFPTPKEMGRLKRYEPSPLLPQPYGTQFHTTRLRFVGSASVPRRGKQLIPSPWGAG